jgi:phosphonoacetate hydrolase
MASVTVNGRTYHYPQCPTVIVCIDGCEPDYVSAGLQRGLLPALPARRTPQ